MHVEGERLCSKMMTVLLTVQGNHVFTHHEVDETAFGTPLQKVIPWKFTYSATYSFPTNKRQEKGEQEKWQNQSLEFQRRRVEVGICLTVSPKQWYLCIDEIQNLAGRGPESHALTEPLITVEWRETPDRVYGTLEVVWYNIFIIPSFLN